MGHLILLGPASNLKNYHENPPVYGWHGSASFVLFAVLFAGVQEIVTDPHVEGVTEV